MSSTKAGNSGPLVLGVGEILWDMLPDGMYLGGAPANFAYYAQACGARTHLVSAVGRDELGDKLLDSLAELAIPTDCISLDSEHPTGTVSVTIRDGGQPEYIIHEGVAWDHIPLTPHVSELASKADAVCFGTLSQRSCDSRATIQQIVRVAPENSLRMLDVNLRQHYFNVEVIEQSLALSNMVKLNDSELPVVCKMLGITGNESVQMEGIRARFNLDVIVLTKGEHGSVILSGGELWSHPGVRTKVSDTVGAGDAFSAAVVMGLLYGYPIDELQDRANRIAAFVCSKPGATTPLPDSLRLVDSR